MHSKPKPRLAPQRLLAGVVILALSGLAGPALAGEGSFQETLERTFEATGIKKVRIQNVNGSIRVGTSEKPEVLLSALKKARGSRAEALVKETEIRITRSGETLEIETIPPKSRWFLGLFSFGEGQRAEVTYELTAPAPIAIDVETVNGRITTERRSGPLVLNTVNGSVKVEGHDASLHVNTVNGSVEVAFAGLLHETALETVNGSVSVACHRDSSFRYRLETVNGRIRSDFPEVSVEGKYGPKEAKGSIKGGRERLAVETVNGEVRLQAVEEARAAATR